LSVDGPTFIHDDVVPDDVRPIVERYVPPDEVDTYLAGGFTVVWMSVVAATLELCSAES